MSDSNHVTGPIVLDNGFIDDATQATFTLSPDYLGSDADQHVAEGVNEAVTEIAKYVNPDGGLPIFAVNGSLDTVCAKYAAANDITPELALEAVQLTLKARCEAKMTRRGRVSLDFDGDGFQYDDEGDVTYHRKWGVANTSQIVFTAIKTSAPSFIKGKQEVMAVFYEPPMPKDESNRRWRKDKFTGESFEVSDDFFVGGYLGIVRWFGSVAEADEARELLSAAVTQIALGSCDTALAKDRIRTLDVRQDRDLPDAF